MKEQEQMIFAIVEAVNKLFDDESPDKRYSWRKIDLTEFFTAYVKAGGYIFNRVTDGDKNFLEFTHLANQLIVQDMLEKGEVAE